MALTALTSIFEEDMYMQDTIDDLDGMTDDSDDIIIGAIEHRYNDNKDHLFTEKPEDQIKIEEAAKKLLDDDKDLTDIDLDDIDIDDLVDDDF